MIFDCDIVGTEIDGNGAGMVIIRGNPWVVNCNFVGNTASGHSGAIYILDNADPNITGCLFEGNNAAWGGAISCTVSCDPTLSDCTFRGNSAFNVGGGVYVRSSSSPLLTNCRFDQNIQAGNPNAGGAGITVYGSGNGGGPCYPELIGCTFQRNTAQGYGGAVHAAYAGNVSLVGCTFELNSADQSGGAVAYIGHPEAPTITKMTDCLLENNVALSSGGGVSSRVATVDISGSQFRNNAADVSGGGCYFEDSASSSMSNTVLCGNTPDQITGAWTDDGGNTELIECAPICETDLNGDGVIDGADLTLLLSSWGDCEVIECEGDVNGDGSVDGADLTLVLSSWGPCV